MSDTAIPAAACATAGEMRRYVRVQGQVQGVGFRPYVYRLVSELGLGGWVRNDAGGVEIEIQGDSDRVQAFLGRLGLESPPLARIDAIHHRPRPCHPSARGFFIAASRPGRVGTAMAPDTAVCDDCLGELFDPGGRRYRYPFINCTHCGPRYTIAAALPYDRANTSMAGFTLCRPCQREYEAPRNRRFHAQPNACAACGPKLALHDARGVAVATQDVIAEAVACLLGGEILALKGLGGFHLACDARNAKAVARLRERKQRSEKPFALMAINTESIAPWVACSPAERNLLHRPERPIVLLPKGEGCDSAFRGSAPGLAWLGVMLPYTPLHYLLFHEAAGRPRGIGWLREPQSLVLVMTSANPGGEPLAIANDEAFRRLSDMADAFVVHDRDIYLPCDDSVMHCNGQAPGFLRRARGYTPRAVRLPQGGPSILACGGWYKNTVCLTRDNEAFVSQHIGDLDNAATCNRLEATVLHLMRVLEIEPQRVAHDLHPDFFSTRFAARFAAAHELPLIGVQHHHAHLAAVMAEHGLEGPALGLALDGVGLGTDGGLWGGELLCVQGSDCRRLGSLKPLPLPGGDRAAREPWRMGASALHALGRGAEIPHRFAWPAAAPLAQMLAGGVNCPPTSSAGRLFDAAAGLLGIRAFTRFEAQAVMELEGLAERHGPMPPYREGYRLEDDGTLNLLPLLARLAETEDAALGAALFHGTFAQALADWTVQVAARAGLSRVVLAGGCFLNRRLSGALRDSLRASDLEVFAARQLPPNDGGLSLGQAWVALGRGPS